MRGFLMVLLCLPSLAWSGQLLTDQVFDRYSPLVEADEFSRRVFSPTTADRLERFQQLLGQRAVTHTVDLRQEVFDIWLPSRKPERGYGPSSTRRPRQLSSATSSTMLPPVRAYSTTSCVPSAAAP